MMRRAKKRTKMPDCELLATCPFFNDRMQDMSEMAETYREQYCKGDYAWCGRYMTFKALERVKENKLIRRGQSTVQSKLN